MKKTFFFILAILLFVINSQFILSENSTNSITSNIILDPITGESISQQVAMSIFVQTIIPYIQIISPKNHTYLKNESILINYSIINGNYVWYNLDDSTNITIDSPIYINTNEGAHILYIFSNNSNGTTSKQINFIVNSSKFKIIYDNYGGNEKGITTSFLNHTHEELQELEEIILENTHHGRIKFNEAINLTEDKNNTDNLLDIDSNIKISSNYIKIDSTELPNFNKSATLWLYGLTFSNPRILKNGVICSSSECIKESYVGNTLKFNVTGFSTYSAEEILIEESISPSGGGGSTSSQSNYSIDKTEILVELKQGEDKTINLTIKNEINEIIKINIGSQNLDEFLKINENQIYLNPKESKIIELNFSSKRDAIPNLYLGKILINSENIQKEILVAIDIESKDHLFDVKMEIPEKYKNVLAGEELLAEIELYNVGSDEQVDVFLEYFIKDNEENVIVKEKETIAVKNYTKFIKKIRIPNNMDSGKYIFYVKMDYDNKIASGSSWFEISKNKGFSSIKVLYLVIIILFITILIMIIEIRKIKKQLKPEYRIGRIYLAKEELVKIKR